MNIPSRIWLRLLPLAINRRYVNYHLILHSSANRQSGAVLIISLIMLLLLTLIATTGMQTSSLEEKMAGNIRDKNLAFQAAESALKVAESSLSTSLPFSQAGINGFYLDNTPGTPNPIPTATAILTDTFWSTNPNATSTLTTTQLGNRINPPVYIIQKLATACFDPVGCTDPINHPLLTPYKITVRATGGSTNAVVILQSIYTLP